MVEMNSEMADILEVDTVADTDELAGFDLWDSLAILSLIVFVDKKYNIQLSNSDLKYVKTLADVKELIESKK